MISDYFWPVARYIAGNPPYEFSARTITGSGKLATSDPWFTFSLLKEGERRGYTRPRMRLCRARPLPRPKPSRPGTSR